MDLQLLDRIKRLVIIAMVSDDDLMDILVLKGGNAIDIVYKLSGRASIDVDFSMQGKFNSEELDELKLKVEKALIDTFTQEAMTVFDVKLVERPSNMDKQYEDFWGGYKIEFKVVSDKLYSENVNDIDQLRKISTVVGPNQKKVFTIDISKFEYCTGKEAIEIDGYTVYVYTVEMLVLEKIRAICQQIPNYRDIVESYKPSPRARDFFDIYILYEAFPFDLNNERILTLLERIFETKKVPLSYLNKIIDYREFHRTDFASVKDTVRSGVELKEFNFYFDYLINILKSIELK